MKINHFLLIYILDPPIDWFIVVSSFQLYIHDKNKITNNKS
jgi:hypothetical protein